MNRKRVKEQDIRSVKTLSDFAPKSKRLGRLIAAAPEMYEVLKMLREGPSPIIPAVYDLRYENFYENWHKIRNILALIDAEESENEKEKEKEDKEEYKSQCEEANGEMKLALENRKHIAIITAEARKLWSRYITPEKAEYAAMDLVHYTEMALDGVKAEELTKEISNRSDDELMIMCVMLRHSLDIDITEKITSEFYSK